MYKNQTKIKWNPW